MQRSEDPLLPKKMLMYFLFLAKPPMGEEDVSKYVKYLSVCRDH